ncbi:MAG: IS3 family transposase [Solobacterium sp.]|nr:IS3 family transposase [Solobacterium sp.]
MCKVLNISRAAYYKWLHRKQTEEEIENERIAQLILEYDGKYKHTLGYRRMRMYINAFNHKNYSRRRIQRIMEKLGVKAQIRKQPKRYKNSAPETTVENLLGRDFHAEKPNEKWTTDVTEFKVPGSTKKIYLSAILDLYDRSIIAFVLSRRNDNKLVFDTFQKAVDANPDAAPVFHSDRGFQYTSKVFQVKLKEQGMIQSMSRVGHCIDNGPTEGFWGILKSELYLLYEIHDEASLIDSIKDYIRYYNEERLQERFGGQTPEQVREAALLAIKQDKQPKDYPIPENKRIEKYWAMIKAKQQAANQAV